MPRFNGEEVAFCSEVGRKYYLAHVNPYKWETYGAVRKAIKAENERRKRSGGTLLRQPSFDAFSRMLTKAVPDDKMHGRPRKVTRAVAANP